MRQTLQALQFLEPCSKKKTLKRKVGPITKKKWLTLRRNIRSMMLNFLLFLKVFVIDVTTFSRRNISRRWSLIILTYLYLLQLIKSCESKYDKPSIFLFLILGWWIRMTSLTVQTFIHIDQMTSETQSWKTWWLTILLLFRTIFFSYPSSHCAIVGKYGETS